MIVDGLGHVSLDSSTTGSTGQANNPLSQANIHQGAKDTSKSQNETSFFWEPQIGIKINWIEFEVVYKKESANRFWTF